ncbi:MAG TPA: YbaB/EbfC family nucleoid-associated protein [Candidatus Woesebacteria bacterium]|nr:YbaB/EbfC family nucleoid-associated protein [Candidatus Woesebacteria bacterium]HNS94410.1 YbaB/EbfC family nucleoid-associated protein [Candidatus Woesebacteria bacterium]
MNIPGIGNLGDLTKMKALQDDLKKQELSHEYNGVKVTVRGDMQLQEISIDGVVENRVLVAVNEAMKKIQQEAAKKLMQMK